MCDADINVAREGNAGVECGAHDRRRKQAIGLLPHEPQAAYRRGLEGEAIGEEEIGVEHNHLFTGSGEQQRVSNLAPAWMTVTEGAQVRERREQS